MKKKLGLLIATVVILVGMRMVVSSARSTGYDLNGDGQKETIKLYTKSRAVTDHEHYYRCLSGEGQMKDLRMAIDTAKGQKVADVKLQNLCSTGKAVVYVHKQKGKYYIGYHCSGLADQTDVQEKWVLLQLTKKNQLKVIMCMVNPGYGYGEKLFQYDQIDLRKAFARSYDTKKVVPVYAYDYMNDSKAKRRTKHKRYERIVQDHLKKYGIEVMQNFTPVDTNSIVLKTVIQ